MHIYNMRMNIAFFAPLWFVFLGVITLAVRAAKIGPVLKENGGNFGASPLASVMQRCSPVIGDFVHVCPFVN